MAEDPLKGVRVLALLTRDAIKDARLVDAGEGGHEVANEHLFSLDVLQHAHVVFGARLSGCWDEKGAAGEGHGSKCAHPSTLA